VAATFVVTATDTARLEAQAQEIGAPTLVRTIDELASALTAVREGDDARMAVEIALLKAARPDLDPDTAGLLRRIERLERQASSTPAPLPTPGADPPPLDEPAVEPSPADPPAPAPAEDPGPSEEEEAEAPPSTPAAPPAVGDDGPSSPAGEEGPSETGPAGRSEMSFAEIQRIWPAVLQKLAETAPALAATFEGARPVAFGDEGLQVGFPPDQRFNKKKAESPERRDAVAFAFEAVAGQALKPSYVLLDGEAPPDPPAPGSDQMDEEELLERLKSEFDAEEVG
jgi:hypothetical protein